MLPAPPDRLAPADAGLLEDVVVLLEDPDLAEDVLLFLAADADVEAVPLLEAVDLLEDELDLAPAEPLEPVLLAVDLAPEAFAAPVGFGEPADFDVVDFAELAALFVEPPAFFAEPDPEVFLAEDVFFELVDVPDLDEAPFPVELDFDAVFFTEPLAAFAEPFAPEAGFD